MKHHWKHQTTISWPRVSQQRKSSQTSRQAIYCERFWTPFFVDQSPHSLLVESHEVRTGKETVAISWCDVDTIEYDLIYSNLIISNPKWSKALSFMNWIQWPYTSTKEFVYVCLTRYWKQGVRVSHLYKIRSVSPWKWLFWSLSLSDKPRSDGWRSFHATHCI